VKPSPGAAVRVEIGKEGARVGVGTREVGDKGGCLARRLGSRKEPNLCRGEARSGSSCGGVSLSSGSDRQVWGAM
jgi:hypothetical protein